MLKVKCNLYDAAASGTSGLLIFFICLSAVLFYVCVNTIVWQKGNSEYNLRLVWFFLKAS